MTTTRVSLSKLLQVSKAVAAKYTNGDLSKVEVEEIEGVYVVMLAPEPVTPSTRRPAKRAAEALQEHPRTPRKRVAKKVAAADPAADAEPDPVTDPATGFRVIELPPVLPPRQRKSRGKTEDPAPGSAPPAAPGSSSQSSVSDPGMLPVRKEKPKEAYPGVPLTSGQADWDSEKYDLGETASKVLAAVRNGLPADVPVKISADVLSLWGVSLDVAEAAVRQPDSVEIAGESFDSNKRYPVLVFRRGDIRTVLGFRATRRPYAMAVYMTGDAFENYKNTKGSAGGGGARKQTGVPKTPGQLITRLRDLGCIVEGKSSAEPALPVVYAGQELGKIMTRENMSREAVEREWQRMQRKVHAIDQKA